MARKKSPESKQAKSSVLAVDSQAIDNAIDRVQPIVDDAKSLKAEIEARRDGVLASALMMLSIEIRKLVEDCRSGAIPNVEDAVSCLQEIEGFKMHSILQAANDHEKASLALAARFQEASLSATAQLSRAGIDSVPDDLKDVAEILLSGFDSDIGVSHWMESVFRDAWVGNESPSKRPEANSLAGSSNDLDGFLAKLDEIDFFEGYEATIKKAVVESVRSRFAKESSGPNAAYFERYPGLLLVESSFYFTNEDTLQGELQNLASSSLGMFDAEHIQLDYSQADDEDVTLTFHYRGFDHTLKSEIYTLGFTAFDYVVNLFADENNGVRPHGILHPSMAETEMLVFCRSDVVKRLERCGLVPQSLEDIASSKLEPWVWE